MENGKSMFGGANNIKLLLEANPIWETYHLGDKYIAGIDPIPEKKNLTEEDVKELFSSWNLAKENAKEKNRDIIAEYEAVHGPIHSGYVGFKPGV